MKIKDNKVIDDFNEHLWNIKKSLDGEAFYSPTKKGYSGSEIIALAELLKSKKESFSSVEELLVKENQKLKKTLINREISLFISLLALLFLLLK